MSATKNNAHNRGINAEAKAEVKRIISRVEKLRDEMAEIADEIKQVYNEAKSKGYDAKALREIVSERAKKAKDPEKWQDTEDYKDILRVALGMV